MNLSQIKRYIQKKAIVSLPELCAAFQVSAEVLKPALECHFVKKGIISCQLPVKTCSGQCQQCPSANSASSELYCWRGRQSLLTAKGPIPINLELT